jgi:hypothetical protein
VPRLARHTRVQARGLSLALIGLLISASAAVAAHPSYHSPGYRGTHKVPHVAPVPPPPPIVLGPGQYPHVFVDAAGTGHIAWSSQVNGQDAVLHYCQLRRGQKHCSVQSSLVPPDADSAYGNSPGTDEDFDGPYPMAIGNELLLLDHRCCNMVPLPDGGSSYDVNFLYTSEDGGKTITGPGIIGTQNPGTDTSSVGIYGGDSPQIGVISDTETGGTFFQGTPAGAFTQSTANLGDMGPDEAVDGRIATDGTRPVVAFADLSSHIFIREYSGTGDVNNPSSWSSSEISGQDPRIVGGPGGVWLAYQTGLDSRWMLRRVVGGVASGGPHPITPKGEDTGLFQLAEDQHGELIAGWLDQSASPAHVTITTSSNGATWGAEQVVAKGDITGRLAIAAASDGGGYAVFELASASGPTRVAAAAFGAINATGQKGLGNLTGGGLGGLGGDQLGTTSCKDVHFGDIDALAEEGCFLRDPANPASGAAVTAGQIRLNGLDIIPDPGVQIIINPRLHTIDTTGAVTVNLDAPDIGAITLWHGELHVNLAGSLANAGQTLFQFDSSQYQANLKGFPIDQTIEVQIQHDAVVIPISLSLPPYMGGVTGQATLLASNAGGLQLSSLHIDVADLELGALEIEDLHIDYTAQGNVWMGGATINIPGGTPYFGISAQVEFDNGAFTMGSFTVGLPFPGVPLYTDLYLASFGGGFDIRPPTKRFFGSVVIGAVPLDPPNYAVTVTGTLSITFTDNGPVTIEVDGSGAVHGFTIATAKLVFRTDGFFEVDGNIDIDLDVADLSGGLDAFVDLPDKTFSAEAKMNLSVLDVSVDSADAIVSSVGVAACASVTPLVTVGIGYKWGGSPAILGGLGKSCDVSAYRVQPVADRASIADHAGRAHAAVASIPVPAHAPYEDLLVTGAGAPPSVLLTAPNGQQITPTTNPAVASPALALHSAKSDQTLVLLRSPAAGNWTITPAPGSSAITAVSDGVGQTPPKVSGHVSGRGATRRLSYAAALRPGVTVSFAELASGAYHVIGAARAAHGTLRFTPTDGPAGVRTIVAIVSENGIPNQRVVIARYHAPGPVTPGRVHGLRAVRHGRTFRVSFGSAAGATHYSLRVTASDGRHLLKLVGSRGHSLKLPVLGYNDRITVSVAGLSSLDRSGPTSRAKASAAPTSHPRSRRRRRHH